MNDIMNGLKCVPLCESDGTTRSRLEIKIGGITVGRDFLLIAGPCSVESEEQIMKTAELVKACGANMLRGGAYKPRTSPYAFQGLGREGIEYLRRAGAKTGLPVITEVVDTRDVEAVADAVDVLQIGARNMQNYSLLIEVGKTKKPVMLKRGMGATVDEWLSSAEYIMSQENENVIFCERGIRAEETYTRNTLDISAVPVIKRLTRLPIIVDPSHATGRRELVCCMSVSATVAGCDGLEIEVHPMPDAALSDSEQQLTPDEFALLAKDVRSALEFRKKLSYMK